MNNKLDIPYSDLKDALVNLLEDSKVLSDELKIEKKSVEEKIVERTRELEAEKVKLLASIEALSKAYIMIDTNGSVILTNSNLNQIFETENEVWTLQKINDQFGNSFNFEENYKDVLLSRKRKNCTDILIESKYLEVRFSPVIEKTTNNLIGVLVIIGDITNEKALARSRDEFFSIASHELRTPLTAIRGNASLIKQYFSHRLKDQELVEMINDIEESSIRLIGIVNDFLNIGRLEQGRMEFKLDKFDINELIKEVVDEYKLINVNKSVKIAFKKLQKPAFVFADKDRTKQVVINLLGNALKFTSDGQISLSVEKSEDNVTVTVEDTGRGISKENQSLLFRKFQQAGDSLYTRDTTKGTGLGLYISKLIVEGMKGEIWLESSHVGKGSVFAFTLPAVKSSS